MANTVPEYYIFMFGMCTTGIILVILHCKYDWSHDKVRFLIGLAGSSSIIGIGIFNDKDFYVVHATLAYVMVLSYALYMGFPTIKNRGIWGIPKMMINFCLSDIFALLTFMAFITRILLSCAIVFGLTNYTIADVRNPPDTGFLIVMLIRGILQHSVFIFLYRCSKIYCANVRRTALHNNQLV